MILFNIHLAKVVKQGILASLYVFIPTYNLHYELNRLNNSMSARLDPLDLGSLGTL